MNCYFQDIYFKVNPPSTASTWPVMNEASSLSRNDTADAISSGWPIRLIIDTSVVQLGSSPVLALSGVSISPGATAFTRTSGSLSFLAKDLVSEIIPAFVAEYITPYGSPIIPSTDVSATMEPDGDVFWIRSPNILRVLNVPLRLTAMVKSIFSSVILSIPDGVGRTPAFATRWSSLPNSDMMKFFKSSNDDSFEISAAKNRALLLSSNSSSTEVSSEDREFNITIAPSTYSLLAVASPIPCVEPVINTTLSSIMYMIITEKRGRLYSNKFCINKHNHIKTKSRRDVDFMFWQGHVESNHDLRFWRPLY